MTLTVRPLTGAEIRAAIADLAALRIAVFAAFPYLYDGDAGYEAEYLKEFVAAPDAVLVAAFDADRIVGAATASPMWAQKAEFRAPFEARGIATDRLFYFGESVLLSDYRGHGIGHAFFDHREEQARRCGATAATFAAVIRPDDHPARPDGYTPLEAFWAKRGYAPVPGFITELAWKEHGEAGESLKPMQYWMRAL
ncbi:MULTISPECIES: GNAT family N-acetyltransferase [unclassified Novosphingobium]|uniref:GNAT family N-acetyltransferase n=1 Tax=unclassified Novosphingobium TaxID=2644732 RepID=UPI0025F31CF6|nr:MULTISPECIES: GNAT family N-acetyltransferase [unclassified Novosphingobium]HQV03616.1 GNAT family N-acetyltransferase [Novosphingobium sp.]